MQTITIQFDGANKRLALNPGGLLPHVVMALLRKALEALDGQAMAEASGPAIALATAVPRFNGGAHGQ